MALRKKILVVTVATAGVRQRIVTDRNSPYRFPKSAYYKAKETNAGDLYIGDDQVSSSVYTDILHASDKGALTEDGDTLYSSGGRDEIDLYHAWVDAASSGDVLLVTIQIKSHL